MSRPFPHLKQPDQMDCGATCLAMVAKHYGKTYTIQRLREMCSATRGGVSMLGISDAAEKLGFKTVGVRVNFRQLCEEMPLPCIVHWRQEHFVVVYRLPRPLRRRGDSPSQPPRKGGDNLQNDKVEGSTNFTSPPSGGLGGAGFVRVADPAHGLITFTA
ncbi:MAG: cysteine peptidase family C39 domain-containing protein, partial [Bacteroidales bacterium]|nr:cysteine peptidase family C39 domain-containing protein [Bacteroidales bacterium]